MITAEKANNSHFVIKSRKKMRNLFVVVVFLFVSAEASGMGDRLCDDLGHCDIVTFRLFTRQSLHYGVTLSVGDRDQLLESGFNASLPTIVSTHGFMDSTNSSWMIHLRRYVLEAEDVNFITVDYSHPAKNLLYDEVVRYTRKVGLYTGQFLEFLQKEGNFQPQNAHLIGHSLGAQALGYAARAFPERTIGRLTGLDPAAPLYEHRPETERINAKLAKVVDVIHTCVFFVGMKKRAGTIDFYPNGGFNQPGCGKADFTCHHGRSREYFYDSILTSNRKKYTATKCKTLKNALNGKCNGEPATMGYYLSYSSPGIYYLKIN